MKVPQLTGFFQKVKEDHRVAASHISLYMALFESWNQRDFQNPVSFKRREVMATAKISGLATFHKCIKTLHELGYIQYIPSYNPSVPSTVVMLEFK